MASVYCWISLAADVEVEQRLPGDLQPGLKLRLHHLVDAVLVQEPHLFDPFGPGHNVHVRVEAAHLIHNRWVTLMAGVVISTSRASADLRRFQHHFLAGIADR